MIRRPLHFVTHGDRDRPAVLLLHGFMGSSSDWEAIVARLVPAYCCICPDLPGHGRSLDVDGPYSFEMAGRHLEAVLDTARTDRAHVVGYSMGGRLALYFALSSPGRCRSLVLESASPGLETKSERAARRQTDEERAARIETGDYRAFLEAWYRQPLFETYRRHEGLLDRMIDSRQSNVPAEIARSLREMGTGSQPSLWRRLAELRMPVLVMAGALDAKYVDLAERITARMPTARTSIVSEAGHNLHAEKPDAYAEILLDFLRKYS